MPPRVVVHYPRLARCLPCSSTGADAAQCSYSTQTLAGSGSMDPTGSVTRMILVPASSSSRYRYLSTLPGPLEAKRRLGKRHMGELYSVHYIPPAEITPVDLSRWTWNAPSPKKVASNIGEHLEQKVRDWVSKLKHLSIIEKPVDWANILEKPTGPDPLMIALEAVEGLAGGTTVMSTELYVAIQKYNTEFSRAVELGLCREDEIVSFANRLFEALAKLRGTDESVEILLSSFLEQLCDGMRRSTVGRATDYTAVVWKAMFDLALDVNMGVTEMQAIWNVMQMIPTECISVIENQIPRILDGILGCWTNSLEMMTHEEMITDVLPFGLLTKRAASILSRFSINILGDHLGVFLLTALDTFDMKKQYNLKLAFTSVLAQATNVRQTHLLDAVGALFKTKYQRTFLPDPQLCNLLLHQWTSRGYLERPQAAYMGFHGRHKIYPNILTLANMVSTIIDYFPVKRHVPTLMSLCEFLRKQNRLFDVVKSYQTLFRTTSVKVSPKHVVSLAAACGDAKIAIALFDLAQQYSNHIDGGLRGLDQAWTWKMWARYVPDLIRLPRFTGKELLELFEMERHKPRPRNLSSEYNSFIQSVLIIMSRERRFSARQRLHFCEDGLAFLRSKNMAIRKQFIMAIVSLVLRDLHRTHFGRISRLNWMRGLTLRYLDPEDCLRINNYIVRSRFLARKLLEKEVRASPSRQRTARICQYQREIRRQWWNIVYHERRRTAIEFAHAMWKRPTTARESWVLFKNHIRFIQKRLRGERFRPKMSKRKVEIVDRRWVVKKSYQMVNNIKYDDGDATAKQSNYLGPTRKDPGLRVEEQKQTDVAQSVFELQNRAIG